MGLLRGETTEHAVCMRAWKSKAACCQKTSEDLGSIQTPHPSRSTHMGRTLSSGAVRCDIYAYLDQWAIEDDLVHQIM